ncbi:MAG: serine protease [Anaerolineae bacterium]|jgi:S1-C subfamily serine protease|nr:serine protease [Anaerolineae bacterium]
MDIRRTLEAALIDIREGRQDYARRNLWALIRQNGVSAAYRADAFVALAQTYFTQAEKRACYGEALLHTSGHPEAVRGLTQLAMPPAPVAKPGIKPPPPPPSNRPELVDFFPVVGVLDGPHGPGSGFFVSADGLIATTRYVIESCVAVTVELAPQRRVRGEVVWSSPTLDLALVETPYHVRSLLSLNAAAIPLPDQPLSIHTYQQEVLYARLRQSGRVLPPDWFPTDLSAVWDAGGGPILNRDNAVVGMLTRNCSRTTPHVYALTLRAILEAVRLYQTQATDGLQRRYCPSCGQRGWKDAAEVACPLCGSAFSEDWLRR